jgi:hypothetical protein
MLAELRSDNQALITSLREAHELCAEENDVATTSLILIVRDNHRTTVHTQYASNYGVARFVNGSMQSIIVHLLFSN